MAFSVSSKISLRKVLQRRVIGFARPVNQGFSNTTLKVVLENSWSTGLAKPITLTFKVAKMQVYAQYPQIQHS